MDFEVHNHLVMCSHYDYSPLAGLPPHQRDALDYKP